MLDFRYPPREVVEREHTSSVGTLVPLLHLGQNPREKIAFGFTEYQPWSFPKSWGRGLSFVVANTWSHELNKGKVWVSSLGNSHDPSGSWTRAVFAVSKEIVRVWLNGTLVISSPRALVDKRCAEEPTFWPDTCFDVSREGGLSVMNLGSLAHTKRGKDKTPRSDKSQKQLYTYWSRFDKLSGLTFRTVAYGESSTGRMIVEETPIRGKAAPFAISTIAFYNRSLSMGEVSGLFSCRRGPRSLVWTPLELSDTPSNIESPLLFLALLIATLILGAMTLVLAGRG